MDDITWRRRVERRRRRKRREPFLLICLLSALIGCALWFFFFYMRTPAYALGEAQDAIEDHDPKRFARYVNLNVLTANAYDDLTVDFFTGENLPQKTRTMFEKYYVTIKPQMTAAVQKSILNYVRDGKWTLPTGLEPLKNRQLGIDYDRFLERSLLRSMEFKGIGTITRQENATTATAEIKIVDKATQTPYTLLVTLEKTDDVPWRITSIQNYRAYLEKIAPLYASDLAAYIEATRPIVNTANKKFVRYQTAFRKLARTDERGNFPREYRMQMKTLITQDIVPALTARQEALDTIEIPPGARYLAAQRKESTHTSILAWKLFAEALEEDDFQKYGEAESMHKRELEIDLRIEEIVKHTTVAQNMNKDDVP